MTSNGGTYLAELDRETLRCADAAAERMAHPSRLETNSWQVLQYNATDIFGGSAFELVYFTLPFVSTYCMFLTMR